MKNDILLKLVLFMAESVHWFTPLVYHFDWRMHIGYVKEPVKVMDNVEYAWMEKDGYTVSSDVELDNMVLRDKNGDYYGYEEEIGAEKVYYFVDDLDEAHLENARQMTVAYGFQEI